MEYFLASAGIVLYFLIGIGIAKLGKESGRINNNSMSSITLFVWPMLMVIEAFTD